MNFLPLISTKRRFRTQLYEVSKISIFFNNNDDDDDDDDDDGDVDDDFI